MKSVYAWGSIVAVLLAWNALHADDHLVMVRSRTYMGTTSPQRVSEAWISDSAVCVKSGKTVTVVRFDRGVVWTIAPAGNRYVEQSLAAFRDERSDVLADTALHKLGFEYRPRYDWLLGDPGREDTVHGFVCTQRSADGDADYAHKTVEMWMTNKVPIRLDRYYRLFLDYFLDADRRDIFREYGELKGSLIMKSRETEEPAIAPTMIFDSEITTVETGTAPQGIYELPEGCMKVNSREDLAQ